MTAYDSWRVTVLPARRSGREGHNLRLKATPPTLDAKDRAILLAIAEHALGSDGWTSVASRDVLYASSGHMKASTWKRRAAALRDGGLLEVRPTARANATDQYRLTDLGREAVAHSWPTVGHGVGHEWATGHQGGEGGDSRPTPLSPKQKDKIPSPDPGPVGVPVGHGVGHERATTTRALRDLLRAMLSLLDAAEGLEPKTEDRIEQERPKASAPASAPAPRTAPRADGLRWDEQDQPDLARALAELRDQHSKRDGARSWQDSRRVEPAWCMRAYAHTVSRLLRGPEQGRRVRDAWGVYLATVARLVERGGDDQELDYQARFPDASESFRQAVADLARAAETRSMARVKAGLGITVLDGPDVSQLAAQRRAGVPLVGVPRRIGEDLARALGSEAS